MKMTVHDILDYIVKFDGMKFGKENKIDGNKICNKLTNLLKKAGFVFATVTCGDIMHYRLKEEDSYNYTEVRIALREDKKQSGRGRYAKYTLTGYYGFCDVKYVEASINPHTGRPWQIGDVDHSHPLRPRLTRNGWYTGD